MFYVAQLCVAILCDGGSSLLLVSKQICRSLAVLPGGVLAVLSGSGVGVLVLQDVLCCYAVLLIHAVDCVLLQLRMCCTMMGLCSWVL
jgi:hypothetical protein